MNEWCYQKNYDANYVEQYSKAITFSGFTALFKKCYCVVSTPFYKY